MGSEYKNLFSGGKVDQMKLFEAQLDQTLITEESFDCSQSDGGSRRRKSHRQQDYSFGASKYGCLDGDGDSLLDDGIEGENMTEIDDEASCFGKPIRLGSSEEEELKRDMNVDKSGESEEMNDEYDPQRFDSKLLY